MLPRGVIGNIWCTFRCDRAEARRILARSLSPMRTIFRGVG